VTPDDQRRHHQYEQKNDGAKQQTVLNMASSTASSSRLAAAANCHLASGGAVRFQAPTPRRTGLQLETYARRPNRGATALFKRIQQFGDIMKKILTAIVLAVTVVSISGCFPIFVPVHDHYDGYHHRGWGGR
jgi:hypothetical protein